MKTNSWIEEFGCHPEAVWARLVAEVCQESGADLVYAPKCFDTPEGAQAIEHFSTSTGIFVELATPIPARSDK